MFINLLCCDVSPFLSPRRTVPHRRPPQGPLTLNGGARSLRAAALPFSPAAAVYRAACLLMRRRNSEKHHITHRGEAT
uniref:Uncharacterized protein n=1 Tax=Enterobacter roggenkampii TaxID=1812935 RepID=A0A7G8AFT7_9ENTR|nr:hypothetical protein [Enterobacter roggenkampii]